MMNGAIEGALQFVIQGLEQKIEAIEAKFISTREDKHLPVHLVIQLIAIGTVVSSVA